MRLHSLSAGLVLATVLGSSSIAVAAGSATTGQSVFAHCAVCHATTPGENKIGPSLAGIVGSRSGGHRRPSRRRMGLGAASVAAACMLEK
jgi:cytochrome c2